MNKVYEEDTGKKSPPPSPSKKSSSARSTTTTPEPPVTRWSRRLLWAIVLLGVGAWLLLSWGDEQAPELSYSEFRAQVAAGEVSEVVLSGDTIRGELRGRAAPGETSAVGEPALEGEAGAQFVTYVPSVGDENLLGLLEAHDVEVHTEPVAEGWSWWPIVLMLLVLSIPTMLLFGAMSRMSSSVKGAGGGGLPGGANPFGFGSNRAKLYEKTRSPVSFEDVAGNEGAKGEVQEIIDFLCEPRRFAQLGAEMPRGVLLVGPPGTGKTLLARAVAGEAGVPFFNITGSDFMEMFVGVGASRVRDMFSEARKAAPCIIFIDELDSIGRHRGAGIGGGHDEREQTLNQLLAEMDGFDPTEGVVIIGATNRPDILDKALLRPGRFDRRVTVDLPTAGARAQILEVHARNKPLGEDVDLREVGRSTPGFSGADLKNLLNEAALLTARDRRTAITRADIENAWDKVLLGLERTGVALDPEERRLVAYHEAGHAVVAVLLPECDPLHKVTIVPRGQAMGVTQQLPREDKYIHRREYLIDRLAVLMGGRAAEKLVFHTATSGAENDLDVATRLARRMVQRWGMSETLGPIAFDDGGQGEVFLGHDIARRPPYSEATAREVDREIRRILDEAFERASELLETHRDGLDRIAEGLLEHEVLDAETVIELVGPDANHCRTRALPRHGANGANGANGASHPGH